MRNVSRGTKMPALPKLPKEIKKSDLKWPKKAEVNYKIGKFGHLELFHCGEFGWVISTLLINKSSRFADRTYGIKLDGKQVRIGDGPHIDARIKLYITDENKKRLAPFIELYEKGLADAHSTRDRISTRRLRRYL